MDPIEKQSTSELVFERLRRAIHLGQYLPGETLPPEREMAEQLGVSRAKVREAMLRLGTEGYLSSRRGPTGGHVVTELTAPKARHLEEMTLNAEGLHHLMEFRLANERLAAQLAAERRGPEDIARIAAAIEALESSGNIQQFRRADSAFHVAVAAASQNPYVVSAVTMARERIFHLHASLDYEIILQTTVYGHKRISDAISRRAGALAGQEMERHLDVALEEIRDVLFDASRGD